jgi:hypothetical protein
MIPYRETCLRGHIEKAVTEDRRIRGVRPDGSPPTFEEVCRFYYSKQKQERLYVPGRLVPHSGEPTLAGGLTDLIRRMDHQQSPLGIALYSEPGSGKTVEGWKAFLDCLSSADLARLAGEQPWPHQPDEERCLIARTPCWLGKDPHEWNTQTPRWEKILAGLADISTDAVKGLTIHSRLLVFVEITTPNDGDQQKILCSLRDVQTAWRANKQPHRLVVLCTAHPSDPPGILTDYLHASEFTHVSLDFWRLEDVVSYIRRFNTGPEDPVEELTRRLFEEGDAPVRRRPRPDVVHHIAANFQKWKDSAFNYSTFLHTVVDQLLQGKEARGQSAQASKAALTRLALAITAGDGERVREHDVTEVMLPEPKLLTPPAVAEYWRTRHTALYSEKLSHAWQRASTLGLTVVEEVPGVNGLPATKWHRFESDAFRALFLGLSLRYVSGFKDAKEDPGDVTEDYWARLRDRLMPQLEMWLTPAAYFAESLKPGEAVKVFWAFLGPEEPPRQLADFLLIVLENDRHPSAYKDQLLSLLKDHRAHLAPESLLPAASCRIQPPGGVLAPPCPLVLLDEVVDD